MVINWSEFTPWAALAGGVLIGLAAALLVLFNGRIAGISGILGGLISNRCADKSWRLFFLAGLLLAPLLYGMVHTLPVLKFEAQPWVFVVSGLLVGFGTRMASGCTSGHGICGLSCLSPRSLAATLSFMATGFAVVFIVRHLVGA